MSAAAPYQTVRTWRDGRICHLQIHRPDAGNTINAALVSECHRVLDDCESWASVVVLSGLPEVFCFGADFRGLRDQAEAHDPASLYRLWLRLAQGPFVSVAQVRGKANAGGVGFAASCDLVLCDDAASFSLSELLFGLVPACVLPFVVRRVGPARAQAMTLLTQPVTAAQAQAWGLADASGPDVERLLRSMLVRLRILPKDGIQRCKRYLAGLDGFIGQSQDAAVACNQAVFTDPTNLAKIDRYLATGEYPWQVEMAR